MLIVILEHVILFLGSSAPGNRLGTGGYEPLKNVLFTGAPGVGKTTLIKMAVRRLGDRAGGFFVEELRGPAGINLNLVTLDGREATLAGRDLPGAAQVGLWQVDLAVLESLGVSAVEAAIQAGRVVVLDEIAPLELASEKFAAAVQAALDGPAPVLGSMAPQAHPVLDAIRARHDTLVIEVTRDNRDRLLDRVWSGLRLPTESLADVERRIARQRDRAARYAADARLRLAGISGEVRGDHGTYQVSWQGGQWHCSCSFFLKYGTCAHTMAAEKTLSAWLPPSVEPATAGGARRP